MSNRNLRVFSKTFGIQIVNYEDGMLILQVVRKVNIPAYL